MQKRIETPTPRPVVTEDAPEAGGDARSVDAERLADALATFDGTSGERRAVARAARDLADDGRLAADRGVEPAVTAETVVRELRQAPDGGPSERWNWWVGSLDVAYGGYRAFAVRRFRADGDATG